MPTGQDFADLLANCTKEWITTNGVNGWLVTGQDAFASKSIFLPVAGNGSGSDLVSPENGYYWSSTPSSQKDGWSEYLRSMLIEDSHTLSLASALRNAGFSVRAVRDTPPPTPITVTPGEPQTGLTEIEAEALVSSGEIAVPDAVAAELTTAQQTTYKGYFTLTKTQVGDTWTVDTALNAAGTNALAAAVDAAMWGGDVLPAIAAGESASVSLTNAVPGFYYWVQYGTEVGAITVPGASVLATGTAVELALPAKAAGATAGFYKVCAGVTGR